MKASTGIENFLCEFEQINKSFVVKDFVGFLNWHSAMGTILLPYTGHHSVFCQMVKENPTLYHKCVTCSNYSQRRCIREQKPFWSSCYLGVSEYTVPILVNDYCVGSISVGACNQNMEGNYLKLKHIVARCGLELEPFQSSFVNCTIQRMPLEESLAIARLAAIFLADAISPYAEKNLQAIQSHQPLTSDFDRIRHYILLNYTDPSINVESIARACNYSPSSVSHIFNTRMRVNIRTYINQLRIVLAKKELRSGKSVTTTAMISGFNDSNYFSSVFRLLVGIPPSQYAKYEKKKNEICILPDVGN